MSLALYHDLQARGFIFQTSEENALTEALSQPGPLSAYAGFDCTGPSLHVGHLLPLMMLRRWQQAGHRPIVLLGGATTLIGDPTGKDQQRQLLSIEQIEENKKSLKHIMSVFLDFDTGAPHDAIMLDNLSWWSETSYLELLREIGPLMTLNRMLTFENVKRRLEREQPLTFLEFNYMLLQAKDFAHLYQNYNCRFQFGGSDQWGNMVCGMDLIHKLGLGQAHVLTTPLLMTSCGKKMGKTENGAVWLNPQDLSSFDYWQFWRNTDDLDAVRFLHLFTDISVEEIKKLYHSTDSDTLNAAKLRLAQEQTRLCRGAWAQEEAYAAAQAVFSGAGDITLLPHLQLPKEDTIGLIELIIQSQVASSKSQARQLIRQGGVKVDDTVITQELHQCSTAAPFKLSLGKKKHFYCTQS